MNKMAPALVCLAAALLAAPSFAQKAVLKSNEYLKTNQYLVADNKAFFAILQGDGNFCVYKGSGPADNKGYAYCAKGNSGAGNYFSILQGDGNFCTYRGTGPGDNKGFISCTGAAPGAGAYFAIMQNDGNFAVYRGTGPGDNKGLVWDSYGAGRNSGGAKGFFNDVGAWFEGAGNTVAGAFKGHLKSKLSASTIQVGGASAELTLTGKIDQVRISSSGAGDVRLDKKGEDKHVDIVNDSRIYEVKGTRPGNIVITFKNAGSETSESINVLAAAAQPPAFTRAKPGSSYMATNQYLRENDVLVADNKSYFAMLQGDGNFCMYRGSGPADNKGNIYCMPGRGSAVGSYFAAVQHDGNFCVYRGTGPAASDNKGLVGCTNSAKGFTGDHFLAVQGDGNLVIYRGTGPGDNKGFHWQK